MNKIQSPCESLVGVGRVECTTYVSDGVDVDIVFRILRMRYERLNKELSEDTSDGLNFLLLSSSLLDPSSCLRPAFVETQETALASSFDQLIRLCNEFGTWGLQPGICSLCLVEHGGDLFIFGEVQGSELCRRVVCPGSFERSGLDQRSAGEVVIDDCFAIGFVDGFGGHVESGEIVRSCEGLEGSEEVVSVAEWVLEEEQ